MAGTPHTRHALQAATHAAWVSRLVEEACNRGDLAILDEVVVPLALRRQLAAFRAAVPDACWTILELIAAGETVVARLAVNGAFSGPLVGLAPPGRPATLTGVAFARFGEGRLAELWLQADLLGFLQQLEVLPPLRLAQAVAVAQVLLAEALLADELSPVPPDPPPRVPAVAAARPERFACLSRRAGGMSSSDIESER